MKAPSPGTKKLGPPFKPAGQKRQHVISFRLTQSELDMLLAIEKAIGSGHHREAIVDALSREHGRLEYMGML
jgi:hypothetical protein